MWKCSCNNWANDSFTSCPYCGKPRENGPGNRPAQTPPTQVNRPVQNTPPAQVNRPVQNTPPAQVYRPVQNPPPVYTPAVPYYEAKGLVIWSWISILLTGVLFGALALSNANKINKSATIEEQQKHIKRCKTWNIVALVVTALYLFGRSQGF